MEAHEPRALREHLARFEPEAAEAVGRHDVLEIVGVELIGAQFEEDVAVLAVQREESRLPHRVLDEAVVGGRSLPGRLRAGGAGRGGRRGRGRGAGVCLRGGYGDGGRRDRQRDEGEDGAERASH